MHYNLISFLGTKNRKKGLKRKGREVNQQLLAPLSWGKWKLPEGETVFSVPEKLENPHISRGRMSSSQHLRNSCQAALESQERGRETHTLGRLSCKWWGKKNEFEGIQEARITSTWTGTISSTEGYSETKQLMESLPSILNQLKADSPAWQRPVKALSKSMEEKTNCLPSNRCQR